MTTRAGCPLHARPAGLAVTATQLRWLAHRVAHRVAAARRRSWERTERGQILILDLRKL